MLAYERMDVYRCAVEFLALSAKALNTIPKGNAGLVEQLKRATLSIPLNIAESSGKTSTADRKRFCAIARGSAMECSAILDACRVLSLIDDNLVDEGKQLLVRIVSMLTKMCR
jgi:four helix bundle protein